MNIFIKRWDAPGEETPRVTICASGGIHHNRPAVSQPVPLRILLTALAAGPILSTRRGTGAVIKFFPSNQ